MSILKKYEINYKSLTETQRYCLDRILDQKIDSNITIQKLSETIAVSNTTIFRTIKKLGYDSFNEFKADLLFEKFDKIRQTEFDEEILDVLNEQYIKTLKLLQCGDIDAIIDRILASKTVLVCGSGMTNYVGRILEIKLNINGVTTKFSEDPWFMFLEGKNLTKDDTVIVLSKTGETKCLIDIVNASKINGAKVILIGETGESTISRICDYKLSVCKVENEGTDIDTRLHIHIAINYLAKRLIYRKNILKK